MLKFRHIWNLRRNKKNAENRFDTKNRHLGRWLLLLFILLVGIFLISGDYGFYKIGRLLWQKRDLQKQIEMEKHKSDSLAELIDRLSHDTDYIEKVAREKLGMVKKNETVYKFIEAQSDSAKK